MANTDCDNSVKYLIGTSDDIVTRCCSFVYTFECKNEAIKKHCDTISRKTQTELMLTKLHDFSAGSCTEYSNSSHCDRYYLLYKIKIWSLVISVLCLILIFSILILVWVKKNKRNKSMLRTVKGSDLNS